MIQVLIRHHEGQLVLQARNSQLIILREFVTELKGKVGTQDFAVYFRETALINRAARKLFDAWLRKDGSLWSRLHEIVKQLTVEEEVNVSDGLEASGEE